MDEEFKIDPEIRNLFKQISTHIRSRMKLIVALFIIGIAIGIPITHRLVDWLLDTGLVPDDVNIIILTPVEFIMLQVRIGAWLGAGLAVLALIIDGAWKSGLAQKSPKPAFTVVISVIVAIVIFDGPIGWSRIWDGFGLHFGASKITLEPSKSTLFERFML